MGLVHVRFSLTHAEPDASKRIATPEAWAASALPSHDGRLRRRYLQRKVRRRRMGGPARKGVGVVAHPSRLAWGYGLLDLVPGDQVMSVY